MQGEIFMNEQNENHCRHNLVECILALLTKPENSHLDIDRLQTDPGNCQLKQTFYDIMDFLEQMPGGFLIYKADSNEEILYANKALLRIFQCASFKEFKEYTHHSFQGLVHPDDLAEVEKSIWEQIKASQYDLDYVEYRIIRKDGKLRWIEDFGHYIRDTFLGEVFYVFLSDVTEKKNRQLAEHNALLLEKKQKEQSLLSLIDRYDKERKRINKEHLRRLEVIEGLSVNYESILYANLDDDMILPYRLSNRLVYQFDNLLQIRSYIWFYNNYADTWPHPEERAQVRRCTSPDFIREKLQFHKTYYINYRVIFNGELQYLQLRFVNVGSKDHISQIVMGYRRVDEEIRREMEQKQLLESALHNATLAITAKNTFLSNMSHDMRTPLNAIIGYTALAKQNTADAASMAHYLARIEESGKLLLGLIDKVLQISWSESDDIQIMETECSLWSILQEIRDALKEELSQKNITLSLYSAGLTHSNVVSDPDQLRKMLLHIANNAAKYTQEGGHISMMLIELESLPNDYAMFQFSVEDNGIGISEEFAKRMYEPFEREKNTTASDVPGTGLGLTIVRNIVNAMGGTIDVKSQVGVGTKFTVTLRIKVKNSPVPVSFDMDEALDQLAGQTILLVEDNEINMEIETEILEGLGFRIEQATDGTIAVEKMQNAKPGDYSLILMDIQMPVMNGREATRAIRRLSDETLSHIPIIALSADAFESDRRKSIESGMDAHLSKPIDIPLLLETIAKTIQNHAYLYGTGVK